MMLGGPGLTAIFWTFHMYSAADGKSLIDDVVDESRKIPIILDHTA